VIYDGMPGVFHATKADARERGYVEPTWRGEPQRKKYREAENPY
jgi:hypothetical protein